MYTTNQSVNINLSLLTENKKQDTYTTQLNQVALTTMEVRYQSNEWYRIYTDGLLTDAGRVAGAGINSDIFTICVNWRK